MPDEPILYLLVIRLTTPCLLRAMNIRERCGFILLNKHAKSQKKGILFFHIRKPKINNPFIVIGSFCLHILTQHFLHARRI